MTPSFSIVIPNYNYGAFVGATIESALAQTWPAVEVIVIDDGSTDNSREVIARYNGIKVIHQENQHQCVAVRNGVAAATGDLIITLDSDDLLMPNACERIAALWREDLVALFFRLETFGDPGQSGRLLPEFPYSHGDMQREYLSTGGLVYPPASGAVFERNFVNRVFAHSQGMTDASHDVWFCFAAAAVGRVATTDEVLSRYRIHASNHSQPGRAPTMNAVLRSVWYAYNAQQSSHAVARSYGVDSPTPQHLIGSYYLIWHLLLRDASTKWKIPPVPPLSGLISGVACFWNLRSVGLKKKLLNTIALAVIVVSPRPVRRLLAERWYGWINDIGF